MPFIEHGFGSSGAGNAGLRRTASSVGVGTSARERERRAVRLHPGVEPTAEAWVSDAREGYCAMCCRGPWASVMGHVVRAHGMTRVELADAAGLTLESAAAVFTSQATRDKHRENSRSKWGPELSRKLVSGSVRVDRGPRTAKGAEIVSVRVERMREGLFRWEGSGGRRDNARGARKRWASWSPERRADEIAKRARLNREAAGHDDAWMEKVRSMRASGLSQREIADVMGVSKSRVSQIVKDMPPMVVRKPPRGPTMETLRCAICSSEFTAVKKDHRKVCGKPCLVELRRRNGRPQHVAEEAVADP